MKLLVHICCGPCSIYPLEHLRFENHELQGYFFNPNIHPYTEWLRRRDTLDKYASATGVEVVFDDDYRIEDYFRGVSGKEEERCRFCYELRLRRAAEHAAKNFFGGFTTTLLVSPYQKHDLIRETGEKIGNEYGTPFYYVDFRPGYRDATERSRELGMYRQKYCGCVFSERERFYKPGKRGSRVTQVDNSS